MHSWNRIEGFGADEVRTAVPAFHPEWARVPLHVIAAADAYGPQSRMRSWVLLTRRCLLGMRLFGKGRIDEPLLQWALESVFGQREDR